jgi:hypothetical protein
MLITRKNFYGIFSDFMFNIDNFINYVKFNEEYNDQIKKKINNKKKQLSDYAYTATNSIQKIVDDDDIDIQYIYDTFNNAFIIDMIYYAHQNKLCTGKDFIESQKNKQHNSNQNNILNLYKTSFIMDAITSYIREDFGNYKYKNIYNIQKLFESFNDKRDFIYIFTKSFIIELVKSNMTDNDKKILHQIYENNKKKYNYNNIDKQFYERQLQNILSYINSDVFTGKNDEIYNNNSYFMDALKNITQKSTCLQYYNDDYIFNLLEYIFCKTNIAFERGYTYYQKQNDNLKQILKNIFKNDKFVEMMQFAINRYVEDKDIYKLLYNRHNNISKIIEYIFSNVYINNNANQLNKNINIINNENKSQMLQNVVDDHKQYISHIFKYDNNIIYDIKKNKYINLFDILGDILNNNIMMRDDNNTIDIENNNEYEEIKLDILNKVNNTIEKIENIENEKIKLDILKKVNNTIENIEKIENEDEYDKIFDGGGNDKIVIEDNNKKQRKINIIDCRNIMYKMQNETCEIINKNGSIQYINDHLNNKRSNFNKFYNMYDKYSKNNLKYILENYIISRDDINVNNNQYDHINIFVYTMHNNNNGVEYTNHKNGNISIGLKNINKFEYIDKNEIDDIFIIMLYRVLNVFTDITELFMRHSEYIFKKEYINNNLMDINTNTYDVDFNKKNDFFNTLNKYNKMIYDKSDENIIDVDNISMFKQNVKNNANMINKNANKNIINITEYKKYLREAKNFYRQITSHEICIISNDKYNWYDEINEYNGIKLILQNVDIISFVYANSETFYQNKKNDGKSHLYFYYQPPKNNQKKMNE